MQRRLANCFGEDIQKTAPKDDSDQTELSALIELFRDSENTQYLFESGPSHDQYVFCVTENGYIGMVPPLSKAGDCIALIYGVRVPLVLRQDSQRYRLVGGSYVHSIMDGEALDMNCDGDSFTLF